ncbi:MAG: arylsulfatase [Urechidicola sp.]|nr:arylsulfatase [Urechidicola sp.]
MKKIIFFSFLVFVSIVSQSQQPNVVLIVTDDQGYGEVAAHGNDNISTPEMDKLYNTGIRLDNFHVNSVCSPSRAAIMTGKYASNVGVWHTLGGRNIIYKDEKILPQFFKESGYKTAMVGKWHLGDNAPYRPEDRGFDEVFRIGGGSLGQVADYWANGLWDGHYLHNGTWVKTKGFCTDVQFDAALDFIDNSKNDPFFLTITTTAPHSPIGAGDEYLKPYLDMGLEDNVAKFYGMVTNIDDNIGRLRKKLDQLKLTENTIVIFMSDNGSANDKKGDSYNGNMRGKKGSLYEGGHRVPCFLYWPAGGWTGGKQLNQVTAHVDLLPTLLKACKIENSFGVEFNGIELNEHIANPSQVLDRYLITEAKVNKRDSPFNSGVVLKNDWRLINGTELFDLKNDFAQAENVIDRNAEIKTDLENHYMNWYSNSKNRFDENIAINITAEKTELFCMDLYPGEMTKEKTKVIWNQKAVLKGDYYRGFWMLDIQESGKYEVTLRRWPETVDEPILKGPHKSKELKIRAAQLIIEGNEIKKEATSSQKEIVFKTEFKKGVQPFQAEFIDQKEEAFSAYYVYIQKK